MTHLLRELDGDDALTRCGLRVAPAEAAKARAFPAQGGCPQCLRMLSVDHPARKAKTAEFAKRGRVMRRELRAATIWSKS